MANMLHVRSALKRWGVPVVEHPGWYARGRTRNPINMRGWINHHTGTPRSAWERNGRVTLNVILNGRTGLRGPLANMYQGRDGVVILTAGGKANHAGKGNYRGMTSAHHMGGLEVESDGQSYTNAQRKEWPKIGAALASVGIRIVDHPDHKEFATPRGRKWDRGRVDPNRERALSAAAFKAGPTRDEDEMKPFTIYRDEMNGRLYAAAAGVFKHLSGSQWSILVKEHGYGEEDWHRTNTGGIAALKDIYLSGRQALEGDLDDLKSGQRRLISDLAGLETIEIDEFALAAALEAGITAELGELVSTDIVRTALAEALASTVFRAAVQ